MSERRQSTRNRTYLGGRIVYNNRSSTIDCTVRNMSQKGAMLVFTDAVTVPDEFDLNIERQGRTRRARMVWRDADEAGIVFLEHSTEAGLASLDLVRRLKASEAENERLRSQILELGGAVRPTGGTSVMRDGG